MTEGVHHQHHHQGKMSPPCSSTHRPYNINFTRNDSSGGSSASKMCETALPVKYNISESDNNDALKPDLRTLEGRLQTFDNWPNKNIAPQTLAEAGFYYTSHGDIVRCPYCYIEGHKWMPEDNPMDDHFQWSRAQRRNCTFLNRQAPPQQQQQQSDDEAPTSASGRDTCGKYGVEIVPNSVPEDTVNLEKLGVTKVKGPAYPEYKLVNARLDSFKLWPKSMKQQPEELSSAGFFYNGFGDQTLCFHCGGGLKDWEENDEPWEQHAMWFPKCNYLLMKKGVDYVNSLKQTESGASAATAAGTSTEAAGAASTSASSCANSTTASTELSSSKKPSKSEESDKDHTLCKICFKNELGVVFLPCGHIVACVDCASALTNCAVCRKPLEATVRAFLS